MERPGWRFYLMVQGQYGIKQTWNKGSLAEELCDMIPVILWAGSPLSPTRAGGEEQSLFACYIPVWLFIIFGWCKFLFTNLLHVAPKMGNVTVDLEGAWNRKTYVDYCGFLKRNSQLQQSVHWDADGCCLSCWQVISSLFELVHSLHLRDLTSTIFFYFFPHKWNHDCICK